MCPNNSLNVGSMKSNQGVSPNVLMNNTETVPQEHKEGNYFQLGGGDSSQASRYLS